MFFPLLTFPSRTRALVRSVSVALTAVFSAVSFGAGNEAKQTIDFNRDIRPILSDKCYFCHGPDEENQAADLRLDIREAAIEAGAIQPSSVADSTLLHRVDHEDPDELMPPPKAKLGKLTKTEIDLLTRWIEEGAEYQKHWAFVPVPEEIEVPETDSGWAKNEIDHFVARSLQERGVKPAAAAEKERWIRRVSFDLTGLPPTLEEIDAFLADESDQAHEKVVDRLLASDAYGERMANDWLDQARYADTFGYQADRDMHVWPWRDWVIGAFNDNLPYDDFVTWQIAGDLLPNATREQKLATTFNRLHRQTNEGGSINEEFRVEYVNDRVQTMGTAFLGLTLECSRCHDHKYDPISMRDFYELTAFFNNIDESGLYSHFTETAPTPAMPLYEGDQEQRHLAAKQKIAALEKKLGAEEEKAKVRFTEWKKANQSKLAAPEALSTFNFDDGKVSGGNTAVEGKAGKAVQFTGDDPHTLGDKETAAFSRTDSFSFSLWLKPSEHKSRMVVFHRSRAAEDSAFRGYELMLYDGKPTFSLVHFWPGNALRVQSKEPLPLNEWTHLTITYDGSSQAGGVAIFRNGKSEAALEILRDQLTRDILHRKEWGDSGPGDNTLQLAGRFRDVGFGGGVIDEFSVFDRQLSASEAAMLAGAAPTETDFSHYALHHDAGLKSIREKLGAAREEENAIEAEVKQIMTMRDMPGQRPAYLLFRGAYDQRRDAVGPGVPEEVAAFSESLPKNRLGLAQWLTDESNPLVSRVAVNRLWSLAFGRGLVGTIEDFGSQGELPTHPELLDWLSREFMDSGWNVKEMLKTIVLSATYRQSSIPEDSTIWSQDPENRGLARGPRYRLPAEQIRDNALAVSGLLKPKLGGPSVNPYELAVSFKPQKPSAGEGLYRRSLYTYWKRTAPPPVMVTFDATSREVCTPKREITATPLQALVLLNGPQYVEAARVLAEKILAGKQSDAEALTKAFRLCTSREPEAREVEILTQLLSEQRAHFSDHPQEAAELLQVGDAPVSKEFEPAELAAWSVTAKALLNFDETCTKR